MQYSTLDSSNPWQEACELYDDTLLLHQEQAPPYATPELPRLSTPYAAETYQPFVEDDLDSWSWPQQLSPLDWDKEIDYSHALDTFTADQGDLTQNLYDYDQKSVCYPYTVSDGSSSTSLSVPSTPITQQFRKPGYLLPREGYYEVDNPELLSTLLEDDFVHGSNLPHLNSGQPISQATDYTCESYTLPTVDPKHLFPQPPSPRLRPISPTIPPSPSPPLPSPLSSAASPPSPPSFEDTLHTELLRRHHADHTINRMRQGTAQRCAAADESAKQLDWARNMLLRFPRESAQLTPARVPSPEAWNLIKEQTQAKAGLFG